MVLIPSSVHSPVIEYTNDCSTTKDVVDSLQNCIIDVSNVNSPRGSIALDTPIQPPGVCNTENEDHTHDDTTEPKPYAVGYQVCELAGRGYGLVATKQFYPGDLIMREKPIIDMPDKIFRYTYI